MSTINKNCFRLVVVCLVLGLLGFLCSEYRENSSLRSEVKDLQVQLSASHQKADTFYIRDSIPVWKERIVELDRTDYKKLLADKELISALQLKVSQIEAENRLLLGTRDTVYLSKDSDSVLSYHDQWADFSYFEEKRRLEYSVRDSLTTYVTREYRHRILWGLIKWGTKGYKVYHVNYNPNSRIYYNKYIRVKK